MVVLLVSEVVYVDRINEAFLVPNTFHIPEVLVVDDIHLLIQALIDLNDPVEVEFQRPYRSEDVLTCLQDIILYSHI